MNKADSMLLLKSPKLLTDIITYSRNDKYNTQIPSIINQKISFSTNSDNINKVDYNHVDFIVGKKGKQKNKRKAKSITNTAKDEIKIEKDIDFSEVDEKIIIRNSKNSKPKKKSKDKKIINSKDIIDKELEIKDIYLEELLTVNELAINLSVSTTDIIKWLFLQGISVTINQLLDLSISTLVAKHYSFNVLKKPVFKIEKNNDEVKQEEGRLRAPVITLLGHVDHGKTSLLKAIRKDNMFIQEAGNITQSIGSYEVFVENDTFVKKLIFLDTPGHEAFINMRERGVDITDLVILVVAADDGLRPQTIEAINYIQDRKIPFIIAINKVDKVEADISKLEDDLSHYDIVKEEKSNNSNVIKISSLNGHNIDKLLSCIIGMSKLYQWKSEPNQLAKGTILEACLNKKKGPVAQLLIKDGTLHKGDIIVAGEFYGKVKALFNGLGKNVESIESTSLAEVLCFTQVPVVGLSFVVAKNEKEAKAMVDRYEAIEQTNKTLNNRISLDDLNSRGVRTVIKQLNLIIKTSTRGVIEAIIHTLSKIKQDKVQLNILMADCGEVSFKDVDLAISSNSTILVFDLNVTTNISRYADKKTVSIKRFDIIYNLIEYVEHHMLQYIDIEYKKNILGHSKVKSLFNINKGVVAGCFVESGKLKKESFFQLRRLDKDVFVGSIDSLKRLKDDVEEVNEGNFCGLLCKDYNSWEIGDSLECYELKALEKTL